MSLLFRPPRFLPGAGGRVPVHPLQPDAVPVDFRFYVPVGTAGDADADGAGSAVAGHADDTDVVGEGFAPELGSDPDPLPRFFRGPFPARCPGKSARVRFLRPEGCRSTPVDASFVTFMQVSALVPPDDKGDVVRRAGRRAEILHFFRAEGSQPVRM